MPTSFDHPDRITLLRQISEGPISALFAGELRRGAEGQPVAVKILLQRRARDQEQFHHLRRSGRRLHRIGHRHVVAATDLARIDGRPALVSPWVDGMDLLGWVESLQRADTALPARVICEILRGVAAALDAALHRAPWGEEEPLGLTHRDLKPSNVMISRDGEVKLLDFGTGLTSLAGRDGRSTVLRAGLERYLSPGRRQGKRGGPASDVYALGLIGLELFSGRWLQEVRDENPIHDRHLAEIVAGLPDLGSGSPEDDRTIRSLLLRMVAFDPEARPAAATAAQTLRLLVDRAPGPSLESFAQGLSERRPLPPEPARGLPEGWVVDPPELAALDIGDPAPAPEPPASGAGVQVPSPDPPRPETPIPAAPAEGRRAGSRALPILAGAAVAAVALAGAVGLALGVVIGLVLNG